MSKFEMGYYVTAGNRWCEKPLQPEVASYTDLDVYLWRQFDVVDVDTGLRDLRQAVKYSVRNGRRISLDLDMGYAGTWKRQINKVSKRFISMPLTDPWDSVAFIDVADEPSPAFAVDCAKNVRAYLQEKGLRVPPIGATFSYQLRATGVMPDLDWIGLEAYVDANKQDDGNFYPVIYQQLYEQARRLSTMDQNIVVVLQAYSRNGGWINMASLEEVQRLGAEIAIELFGTRLLALKLFSWGRPSGTKSLPNRIRRAHEDIFFSRVELPPPVNIPAATAPSGAELWVTKIRAGNVPPLLPETPGKLGFDIAYKLQESIWGGARDWTFLLQNCPGAVNGHPLRASASEIRDFADVGYALDEEGGILLYDLGRTHREYNNRVAVRKDRAEDFMTRLIAHLDQAHKYRADFDGQPGDGVAWNSVRGWCQTQHPT